MIIGIDPGLTGALVLMTDHGAIMHIEDMPVSAKTNGKGKQVNAVMLSDIISDLCDIAGSEPLVVIERVSAMPGQGVTSMFGFGRSLGVIEGVTAALGLSVRWVTPQKWKKHFSLLKKDKDASRTLVIEKYPKYIDYFKRKKDSGRADAVLIGLMAWQ